MASQTLQPSPGLLLDHKSQIARELWGLDLATPRAISKFKAFFEHYQQQVADHEFKFGTKLHIQGRRGLLHLAQRLKQNPDAKRDDFRSLLRAEYTALRDGENGHGPPATGRQSSTYGTMVDSQSSTVEAFEIDAALATLIKIMFAINLSISPGRILVGQSGLEWKENQALEALIQDAFPVYDSSDEPHTPLRPSKLRARYLETYADIQIEWTHHLPDHLKLDIGHQSKILRVYYLASLLEMTYESLKDEPWQLSLRDSLKRGTYSPAFLYETLHTIILLFPAQDRQWLDQKINAKSSWYNWKRRGTIAHDQRLSLPFRCYHGDTLFGRPLSTRRELFARYPHWAVRLHILYTEAEDPTPVTRLGRWMERRRAARHTFWLTFVALLAAALFGITATLLAAIQVWISWCQWKGKDSGNCT